MNIRRKMQLRKNVKRILPAMLSIALSANALFPSFGNTNGSTAEINYAESNSNTVTAQSEGRKPVIEQEPSETDMRYSVYMNYSERYPRNLRIAGNKIRLERIPLTSKFNYIWLMLKDENREPVYSQTYKNTSGDINFTIDDVSDGRYSAEVFSAPEEYTSYKSIFHGKDVEIILQNGKLSLVSYPYFEHNTNVLNNKRTDETALSYYRQPSYDIQSDNQEIINLAADITSGIENNYDKAVAIHDWVANNIYYDYDSFYSRNYINLDTSALGTLHSQKSVCEGYANLTAALLRAAGIPAKKVSGFALGVSNASWPENFEPNRDSNHAWNEAWLNGRWVIIDTTWDSQNTWENGGVSKNEGLSGYHYFDISPDLFSADHVIKDYSEENIPKA